MLERAAGLCETWDLGVIFPTTAAVLGDERGFRGTQARASHLLGEISARRDPPEATRPDDHYRRALALADELGLRPLVAHCHLCLGRIYRRAGDRREAAERVATAMATYLDLDMRVWLEQANALEQAVG